MATHSKSAEAQRRANIKLREANRGIIQRAKDVPCANCGGKFPTVSMDFDHTKDDKFRGVALLVNWGSAHLIAEIKKCEVVCSNCHRIRTNDRHQYASVAQK